jgi:hypothetical protein
VDNILPCCEDAAMTQASFSQQVQTEHCGVCSAAAGWSAVRDAWRVMAIE